VEAWGKEASAFTRQFIGKQPVRLKFDAEKLDQHDRYLAYVWVEDRLLNEELVRAGLAKANTHYDNDPAMERRLSNAESEARKAKRGIWSEPARN
jgi:micrococcal nuclease